jgi:glyoxylate carboligase
MAQTVGDFIVERLHQWGVRRIFGYPGDGINGLFGALNRADGKIEFMQARHEEMATPEITLDQARHFMRTIMEGDPKEGSVIVNTAKQVVASVFSGKKES